MDISEETLKNSGPPWGYALIRFMENRLPKPIFRQLLNAGSIVAWMVMKSARAAQQEYWTALTGKPPSLRQQWKHFAVFAENLVGKLALDRGEKPVFKMAEGYQADDFMALCQSDQPALFGTFHIAESDLMGSMLTSFGRKIYLVRLKKANSLDTQIIERSFGGMVNFIYVKRPEEMMFAIKNTIEAGHSLALQCDRYQFGSKLEAFDFLGKRRQFPFTIYHLSALFGLPVAFSFALKRNPDGSIPAYIPPVFHPKATRRQTLEAGKTHFQFVLSQVERILREDPTLWFNFEPLNPAVES